MDSSQSKIQSRIDRISELPNPILCKILCLLPIKNAFAATILSTKWRNLFPIWIPATPITLDIDDSVLFRPGGNDVRGRESYFAEFVDKLFNETLRDVFCLDTMTLTCEKRYGDEYNDDRFLSWVSAAVRLHVRELRLKYDLYDALPLFESLNGCTKLTLELTRGLNFLFKSSYIKPTKLKTLSLCSVVFGDDVPVAVLGDYVLDNMNLGDGSMMTTLSDGCPELEELSLIDCDLQSLGDNVLIKFPRLKTLIIRNSLGPSYKFRIETPELKSLDLFNVIFDAKVDFEIEYDESGFERGSWYWMSLITDFPVLEELFLTECEWQDIQELIIESSLLRSLSIRNKVVSLWRLKLTTPNLQLLLLNGLVSSNNFISPLNSHIDIGPNEQQLAVIENQSGEEEPRYYKDVRDLVRYACDTRDLYLATGAIEVLRRTLVDLPTFHNLASLKLGCLCRSGWKVLARLLCNAPYLEKLVFEKGFEKCKSGYAEFESVVSSSTMPNCLKLNLKEIDILEFNDMKDGFKLIEYFLKSSEIMQRLKIQCLPIKKSSSLHTLVKLSMNPKIVIVFACWKDEMLLKEISSHVV